MSRKDPDIYVFYGPKQSNEATGVQYIHQVGGIILLPGGQSYCSNFNLDLLEFLKIHKLLKECFS